MVSPSSIASNSSLMGIGLVAQTNLQLWHQLHGASYSSDELRLMSQAYKCAIALFSGRFRASGKTFIAHLVGTASILAHLRSSGTLVAAGLLHAAYDFGDFGGWSRTGITRFKRIQLQQAVGNTVEGYIAGYSALTWNSQTIPEIFNALPQWDVEKKEVLLIRLANELEEYLDSGLLYCGKKNQVYNSHQSDIISMMAKYLGYPKLAEALVLAHEAVVETHVFPDFVNPTGVSISSLIIPNSCQRKLSTWLSQEVIIHLTKPVARLISMGQSLCREGFKVIKGKAL